MFNKLKKYDELLELDHLNTKERKDSLQRIFQRDFLDINIHFKRKLVRPTPKEGKATMDTLFHHLTTCSINNKENTREYDRDRSLRIHWIKHHIHENTPGILDIFSVKEKKTIRTYIYDKTKRYVIILEPKNSTTYYLITAYYISRANYFKIESKSKRRLAEIY